MKIHQHLSTSNTGCDVKDVQRDKGGYYQGHGGDDGVSLSIIQRMIYNESGNIKYGVIINE